MKRRFVWSTVVLFAAACGGSLKPATTPAPPPADGSTSGAPATAPTTAEGVIEGSLAAQGGRAKLAAITSIKQSGTLSITQMGMTGPITILMSPPRNMLTTVELKGLGSLLQGTRGDLAWELNPMTGARIITGSERAQLLRDATFNGDLQWKTLFPKAELGGVVEFAGQQAYKVTLTAVEGDTQTRYFAKDTLLPVGVQMVADSQMGKVPVELEVSDYRDVGGVKYPHKVTRKEGPQSIEIVLDKVEINAALPATAFDLPPPVAALQKK